MRALVYALVVLLLIAGSNPGHALLHQVEPSDAEAGRPADVSDDSASDLGRMPITSDQSAECTPHPPIRIMEDEGPLGFVIPHPTGGEPTYRPGAGVRSGTGTATDPYVISGWCIVDLEGPAALAHGIHIESTSAHVRIEGNQIQRAGGPVYLPRLTPDTSTLPRTYANGIHLHDVENFTLDGNHLGGEPNATFVGGHQFGVHISDSRSGVVENNLFWQGAGGLHLARTNDIQVFENRFNSGPSLSYQWVLLGHHDLGLLAEDAHNLTIRQNSFDSHFVTMHVRGGESIEVVGNDLWGGLEGLIVEQAANLVVRENAMVLVDWPISIDQTNGVLIAHNDVQYGDFGVIIGDSSDAVARNNTFHGGSIIIGGTHNATVTGNHVSRSMFGVACIWSPDCRIERNHIVGGDDPFSLWIAAVFLRESPRTIVHDNDLTRYEIALDSNRSGPVDARNNWWGCPHGPEHEDCGRIRSPDPVLVEPWRREPVFQ